MTRVAAWSLGETATPPRPVRRSGGFPHKIMAAPGLGLGHGSLVNRAVLVAQLAVQADKSSADEATRRLVVSRYRRSVTLIGTQLAVEADASRRTSLLKYAVLYQERARAVATAAGLAAAEIDRIDLGDPVEAARFALRPPPTSAEPAHHGAELLRTALRETSAQQLAAVPAPAPSEEWRRTYWLLGLFRQSMLGGGHLTADGSVFVPRAVWAQRGVRLVAPAVKCAAFAELLAQTAPFAALLELPEPDAELVLRELGLYCETIDAIRDHLARSLPSHATVLPSGGGVPAGGGAAATGGGGGAAPTAGAAEAESSRLAERMKGLGHYMARTASMLGTNTARVADTAEYVALLASLLAELRIFERLRDALDAPGAPAALARGLHLLEHVDAFVRSVVLVIVSQDLSVLLTRYLRKAEASFVSGE